MAVWYILVASVADRTPASILHKVSAECGAPGQRPILDMRLGWGCVGCGRRVAPVVREVVRTRVRRGGKSRPQGRGEGGWICLVVCAVLAKLQTEHGRISARFKVQWDLDVSPRAAVMDQRCSSGWLQELHGCSCSSRPVDNGRERSCGIV